MEKTRLSCFVVMPFGDKTDARGVTQHFDNVYEKLICPAVKSIEQRGNYEVFPQRADKIPGSGSIHLEMFQQLLLADIVVVDLTVANPNVFYELGVRHALQDRITVLIREEHTAIPFNVAGQKVIEYRVQFGDPCAVIEAIRDDIEAGLRGRSDSPVLGLLGLEPRSDPYPLKAGTTYRADVRDGRRFLEIVTGPMASQPRGANIWVNSENVYFSMARPFETSVSGTIRWLGETVKEVTEEREGGKTTVVKKVIEDTVFDALELEVAGRTRPANPYEVIITEPGGLASRGVVRVCHVASVWATKGAEFRPVDRVERCVSAVLRAIGNDEMAPDEAVVLFPLLGTGKAGGKLREVVEPLLKEAVESLRSDWIEKVKTVRFLALTNRDLDACLLALAGLELPWQKVESAPSPLTDPGTEAHEPSDRQQPRDQDHAD